MSGGALAPFAEYRERWSGNVIDEDSPIRTDGAFLFDTRRAVTRRGTHKPHPFRERREDEKAKRLLREWPKADLTPWSGDYEVRESEFGSVDRIVRLDGEGGCAYADTRYLSLAARLLEPTRVTFMPHDSERTPYIVFWREGKPCGLLMQVKASAWERAS